MEPLRSNQSLSSLAIERAKRLEKENENLKVKVGDLMVELAEWKEKAFFYTKENEHMTIAHKEVKAMYESAREEIQLLKPLLKKVL